MNLLNCPVCNGQTFSRNQALPELGVLKCSTCGLLISDIDPSLQPKGGWDVLGDLSPSCALRRARQLQARMVLHHVSLCPHADGEEIWLDIGCGLGEMLVSARVSGYRVMGVEPDPTAYKEARALIGDSVHLGIMSDAVVTNASVGIVSTLDVLEHIPPQELSTFASLVYRKLKPGGLWVIKVPSTEGLYFTVIDCLRGLGLSFLRRAVKRLWQLDYVYPHTVYFKQSTLVRFMRSQKFEIVRVAYLEDIPNETILDRLLMDRGTPAWQAYLVAPIFLLINFIEKFRNKSDALLVVARRVPFPELSLTSVSEIPITRQAGGTADDFGGTRFTIDSRIDEQSEASGTH